MAVRPASVDNACHERCLESRSFSAEQAFEHGRQQIFGPEKGKHPPPWRFPIYVRETTNLWSREGETSTPVAISYLRTSMPTENKNGSDLLARVDVLVEVLEGRDCLNRWW